MSPLRLKGCMIRGDPAADESAKLIEEKPAMSTTQTQHAINLPPVADSQFLQSSLLAMAQAQGNHGAGGPPALAATPTLSGLVRALRRRWPLALGIAAGATVVFVLAVFVFMPPKFNVQMRHRIVAKQASPDDVEYPIFKANMEALVRSPFVISNALNDKTADGREIKDLEIVRSRGPAVHDWLEKNLKTDYLLGPEVLRVTLAADQADDAAELLNAIGRAFQNEYTEMERSKKQQRLTELRKQKEKVENELVDLRRTLKGQLERLALQAPDQGTVEQLQWLNRLANAEASRRVLEDECAKSESKKYTSIARLKTLDKLPIPDGVLYELYSRDSGIQAIDRQIAKLDDEIADYNRRFDEPYRSQYTRPKQEERAKAEGLKKDREALLKPSIEVRYRESVKAELEATIATADLTIDDSKRQRGVLAKEIHEYERKVKDTAPSAANRPAQVLATEEKIEGAKKALEFTGQAISNVEVEPLAARVVSIVPATPPLERDRTQQSKIAGAGGLGIFILALFGVAFFEFRSRKIGSSEDVGRGLGLKVVGAIPALSARTKAEAGAESHNQLHEAVDAVRTVLLHQARTEALHVIMITSANSGEGKTTLATQLAASLSRAWKRTLVIDGDLRHPGAHTLFEVPQEPGLAEVLRGEVEATDAIRATAFSRLWVLPAGNGDAHAIQALAQDNVRTLFEQLKQQYDFIIIDAPPVLPVTDSLLLGQHVDGVLFAILTDVSRAPAVYAAQQKLAPLDVHTLGAVLLGTEPQFSDKNYRYTLAGK
jgi:capsular exopolysaccharide synthesis family protein